MPDLVRDDEQPQLIVLKRMLINVIHSPGILPVEGDEAAEPMQMASIGVNFEAKPKHYLKDKLAKPNEQ
jgi:hypothetical protein